MARVIFFAASGRGVNPKILGLNAMIFGTVFGQSMIVFEYWFWSQDLCLRVLLCVLVFGAVFSPSWKW